MRRKPGIPAFPDQGRLCSGAVCQKTIGHLLRFRSSAKPTGLLSTLGRVRIMDYEPTSLCSTPLGSRAAPAPRGPALGRLLHRPPLSNPPGQQPRPAPSQIARNLACARGTVRNAIHAFHAEGACLREKSSRPHSARPALDDRHADALTDLLHHSPRLLGKPTSLWTLDLLAEVCYDRGWTPRRYTGEAIRLALKRLGIRWRRAKHWVTSLPS